MPKRTLARKRRGTASKRTSNKKSSNDAWLDELKRHFDVYVQRGNDANQMMISWSSGVSPARMPAPAGPSRGAMYSTVECIRQTDMTLPTGSAIVGGVLRQSTASDVFASYAFALADIPNVASLGSLFDQYRIEKIQLRFKSRNPALFVSNATSPNNASCEPFLVIDRDDNTAPTTISELQQYDNCQQFSAQDSFDVIFEPSITPSVFASGAFSGYSVDDSGKYWFDLANTSIPHYGVKVGIPALTASTAQRFDWLVTAWYKVSFKNKR